MSLFITNATVHQSLHFVKFWNYSRFIWPFLYISWVSKHLMCIIKVWTASTCSGAPKLVEKSHVWPWVNSRSHARNGNEIQTSGRRCSAGKIEKLGFLIPVNPKHAWKSWNLAWWHDMAPTCCGNFSVRFAKAHILTINKVILEQVRSRYNRKHKYYWNRGRSTY